MKHRLAVVGMNKSHHVRFPFFLLPQLDIRSRWNVTFLNSFL